MKTVSEMHECEETKDHEKREHIKQLEQTLKESFVDEGIELLEIRDISDECEYTFQVNVAFTLDGYRQKDLFFWKNNESQNDFIAKVKRQINCIKELRERYPEYCKKNDFIQKNRVFCKTVKLTHMGYDWIHNIKFELADYMKLPNITNYGICNGDYEIKKTPQRVKEYNKNIDITIDALIDCIAELKQIKYIEGENDNLV